MQQTPSSPMKGRPTAEAILDHVVSSGTQDNYANHNVDLTLWIFENDDLREEMLTD